MMGAIWERVLDFADWADQFEATPFIALAGCFALTCFALWLGGQTW